MSLNKTQSETRSNSFKTVKKSTRILRNNSTLTEKSDTIVSVTPTNSFGAGDKFRHRTKIKLQKSASNVSNSSTESENSRKRSKIKKSNTTSLYDLMYVDGKRMSHDRGRLATKYFEV